MSRTRKRRKLKAEINVVPYIDVMLVLLIIFMVTAPLLNLGVDVDLPKSKAHALEQKKESLVVIVDANGAYSYQTGNDPPKPVASADELGSVVAGIHRQNPEAAVFLAAPGTLDYQKVMDTMTLLQNAGIPKVALMSQPARAGAGKAGQR
ncbi:MAG TPA: protein TolR [Xanthomonadaceae bacterium]|jgi:biopolymer transport protein TolR